MKKEQMHELLFQALETELGGAQVYQKAIECAQEPELKEEWERYLEETRTHAQVLEEVFARLGLDSQQETPGRQVVRHKAQSLVTSMAMAKEMGGPDAGQLAAAEAVVEAETKDHQNWELIGMLAKEMSGREAEALEQAHAQVEDQEDEHLYHTMGWARELWLKSLGMKAVIPPPEEEKQVKTAIGAARAKQSREQMLPRKRKAS
jgi:ferritin-like metal-binding protein YciE